MYNEKILEDVLEDVQDEQVKLIIVNTQILIGVLRSGNLVDDVFENSIKLTIRDNLKLIRVHLSKMLSVYKRNEKILDDMISKDLIGE